MSFRKDAFGLCHRCRARAATYGARLIHRWRALEGVEHGRNSNGRQFAVESRVDTLNWRTALRALRETTTAEFSGRMGSLQVSRADSR